MSRGRCVKCLEPTEPTGGAGSKGYNDKRESHWADAAVKGHRVGYAIELGKGDVLICSACLPSLVAEAIRGMPTTE